MFRINAPVEEGRLFEGAFKRGKRLLKKICSKGDVYSRGRLFEGRLFERAFKRMGRLLEALR